MQDLNRTMASGAAWMIFFRAATRGLGFLSTVILARLLVPADFGLVALATAIAGALELMSSFSFDIALIQRRDAGRAQYDTAWTITIVFGALTGLILALLSAPAAAFYDEPRLVNVMLVLAAGTMVEGFENIGVVAFRKDMDFRKEFFFQVAKKMISFAVTVPLAFWLHDYRALVAGLLAGKLGGTTLSFLVNSYRPRLSTAAWEELFHFSRWLFVNNILYFLRHRSADFIVGKQAGPAQLGLFAVSYELAHLPTNELVAPINRAVFPAYATISHDRPRLQESYVDVVSMIALFALPAALGIMVVAEPLVAVILGPRWADTVPLIQLLGIAGVISAMETNIGAAYLALGRPDILTRLYGFYAAIFIALLVVFTPRWGATGAAWASLVTAIINVPVYFGAMLSTLELSLGRFMRSLYRPLTAGTLMAIAVAAAMPAMQGWLGTDRHLALLLAAVALGVFVYTLVVALLWSLAGRPDGSAEAGLLDRVTTQLETLRKSARG